MPLASPHRGRPRLSRAAPMRRKSLPLDAAARAALARLAAFYGARYGAVVRLALARLSAHIERLSREEGEEARQRALRRNRSNVSPIEDRVPKSAA